MRLGALLPGALFGAVAGCGQGVEIVHQGGSVIGEEEVLEAWEYLTAEVGWREMPGVTVYLLPPGELTPLGEGYSGMAEGGLFGLSIWLTDLPRGCHPRRSLVHELGHLWVWAGSWGDLDGGHGREEFWAAVGEAEVNWIIGGCYE